MRRPLQGRHYQGYRGRLCNRCRGTLAGALRYLEEDTAGADGIFLDTPGFVGARGNKGDMAGIRFDRRLHDVAEVTA